MNTEKKESIVVIGYGWIGQANALSLVKMGYSVKFYDPAETINNHYVHDGEPYEKVERIFSLSDIDSPETWYIVCVGDRVSEERTQDISLIKNATDALRTLKGKVILRSTVLPQKLKELSFDLYVPEFLHEKNAVDECLNPYYFVLGNRNKFEAPSFLRDWERRSYRTFKGTPEEASYIKYLSNLWNTIRIAFVNEIGDSMGTPRTKEDIIKIERVLDFVLERKMYLRYGQAFDGHCLPKDTRAFIGAHQAEGKNVDLLVGAYSSNEHHKAIQEKYSALPKVFSFWEKRLIDRTFIRTLWVALNQIPLIQTTRKELRFIPVAIMSVFPDRTISRSNELWEEKARENALYYANPITPGGETVTEKELYETGRSDYERYIVNDPLLERILKKPETKRALDFGSGVGRMTIYFAHDFENVHGIDVSETMIQKAQKRIDDLRVSFQLYDGRKLPYPDNHFDFIFSFLVLQHIPSHKVVEEYMREFYRTAKKDSVIKVQLRGGRGVRRWEWSYGASYTPEEAMRMAERVGFEVLNHEVIGIKYIWLTLKK